MVSRREDSGALLASTPTTAAQPPRVVVTLGWRPAVDRRAPLTVDAYGGVAELDIACSAPRRAERRALVERYERLLEPLAPAALPLARRDDDSWLMAVVRVAGASRDAIRASMAAEGVATSVHYPSLARHPMFGRALPGAGCGEADREIVTLPTWIGLEARDQQRVVDALGRALDGCGAASAAVLP